MIFIYGNAQSYHITASKSGTVASVLSNFFKKGDVPYLAAVSAGGVWNGNQRVKHRDESVAAGQTLKVYISPTQSVLYQLAPDQIVSETRDYIVVLKPAGLSTVPDRACNRFNLTAAVAHYLRARGARYTPTAISRLDLMVQGIVIFPKHKSAEKKLFSMMQGHQIRKSYRLKLQVGVDDQWGAYRTVNLPLDFGKKGFVSESGRESCTKFLRHSKDGCVWTAVPVTGRRHQIRVHASATIGPIEGDTLYGGKKSDRIQLSAVGLNFWWEGRRERIRYSGEFLQPLTMVDGRIEGQNVIQS